MESAKPTASICMAPPAPRAKRGANTKFRQACRAHPGGLSRKTRRRAWLSLRFKFVLWVISLVMYLGLALGFLFVQLTEQNVRKELRRRGANMAQLLAHRSCPYILDGETESLSFLVRSAVQDEDVMYATVCDDDGVPLVTTLSNNGKPPAQGSDCERSSGEDSVTPGIAADVVEVAAPITAEMARAWRAAERAPPKAALQSGVGTVYLGLSTTREGKTVALIARQLALLMVLSCLLSIMVTILAERRITRPVDEVVRATKAIASGDLSLRVGVSSSDELGQLAQSFNKMADALSATMDKLGSYSRSLEDKVRQRTDELEAKTRALQNANAELQELDRMKSGFISNVSHELRTPLTSIKAIAEILGQQGQKLPSEQTLEFLRIIETQTDRLTRLIGDILDLSRLENDSAPPDLQAVSMHDAVSEALNSVRALAAERQVDLSSSGPQDLPSALAHRDKVVQVLVNLLGNALKFTSPGGSVSITVRHVKQKAIWRGSPVPISGIVASVADTGIGIPDEQIEAVFDRFKQVESAAWGRPPGSGLGLSISKEIVERLGGTIWAESELGKGSIFHFALKPADTEKLAATGDGESPPADRGVAPRCPGESGTDFGGIAAVAGGSAAHADELAAADAELSDGDTDSAATDPEAETVGAVPPKVAQAA